MRTNLKRWIFSATALVSASAASQAAEGDPCAVSADGSKVLFTSSSDALVGNDLSPLRPDVHLKDLNGNAVTRVVFTTSQGLADGSARLSPSGLTLAFSSRADHPEGGDNNPKSGVFALDIASGSVRLVSSDAAGNPLTFPGFAGIGPVWGLQAFLGHSGQIAFSTDYDTSVGPAGVYVKSLATGSLNRVLGSNLTYSAFNRAALSFSDDGRRVAYTECTGGGITHLCLPRVLDLATGASLNAATLSNGTVSNGRVTTNVLLSRDARAVVFGNNATNLLGGVSPLGGAELRAYRKRVP